MKDGMEKSYRVLQTESKAFNGLNSSIEWTSLCLTIVLGRLDSGRRREMGQHCLLDLNTKRVVKDLYKIFKGECWPVYHLSTSMCAAHRKEKLQEILNLLVGKFRLFV